jgi:hypothetical protein
MLITPSIFILNLQQALSSILLVTRVDQIQFSETKQNKSGRMILIGDVLVLVVVAED